MTRLPLPPVNRIAAGLVIFFLLFAVTIDRYWLVHHDRLPELAGSNWMARMYRDYSSADRAYYDRPGKLEIGLETLNVCVTPLAYLLILWGMARRRAWRYPLQLSAGAWVAYSVCLDFWIAAISGYPGMQHHTLANFIKFYAANAPWLLGHLYLAADAARAILPVLRARGRTKRADPVRITPSFDSARTLRQKARAAGLHPNYWYAVELEGSLKKGRPVEAMFWGGPIVLFRGDDGRVAAQGREPSYPVRVRYGLIWIFPGDPQMAAETSMPEIPELEGRDRWACLPFSYVWHAHHSIIIDNLSDLTHGYLHRDRQAFSDPVLLGSEMRGDAVYCKYRVHLLDGPLMKRLLDRTRPGMDLMDLVFQYPYQWGNSADSVKHWILLLPVDARTTRVFFLFYFDHIKIPFTPCYVPRRMMTWLLRALVPLFIQPLVSQDGEAVDWEQRGYERYFDAPLAEICPAVPMFQEVVVRKWEEHLAAQRHVGAETVAAEARL